MAESGLSKLFDSHLRMLDALLQDLKDNPTTCSGDGSTLEFFWIKMCLAVHSTSKDATSMCMMFSGPPLATKEECESVLRKLEGVTVALVSTFYSLPLIYGLTLKKQVHCAVTDILNAVHWLSQTIQAHNFCISKEQLQKTGNVWDCCDSFPNLPRDNASAVLKDIKQCLSLVNDALQEIEEAQKETEDNIEDDDSFNEFSDMNNDPTWSDSDRQLTAPALGLVKAAKAGLKKTAMVVKNLGTSQDSQQVEALDKLNERLRGVSPGVDEVISCLYPPIDHPTLRENVTDLTVLMENVFSLIRHSVLACDTDEMWLNFLVQAVQHNNYKLYQLIPGD